MGRKSSSKGKDAPEPQAQAKGTSPLLYVAIGVAVVAIAAFALRARNAEDATPPADPAKASTEEKTPPADTVSPELEASVRATAAIGAHKQATLPPIPFQGYDPPRPPAVVTAAYQFAAEHPEITSYVPCFCGCEQGGHRGNHDCFVKERAPNGDVTQWEPHGLECAVCLDVATRSRQMYASGASVREIRAAIEKEFASTSPVMTPTPKPPAQD